MRETNYAESGWMIPKYKITPLEDEPHPKFNLPSRLIAVCGGLRAKVTSRRTLI